MGAVDTRLIGRNQMPQKSQIHISQIMVGDTVEHNGEMVTVGAKDIRGCAFMGRSIFGDSYNLGYKLVTKIRMTP